MRLKQPGDPPWKGPVPTREEIVEFAGRMGREAAQEGGDPFAIDRDATPDDCEIRGRAARPQQTVGLGNGFKPKPRKVDLNPLERRWFEREGWAFARVEHANAWSARTIDLFGFGDWLACKPGEGVVIVQTCRHDAVSTRAKKAMSKPELRTWLESGGRFLLHGWLQKAGKGSRWELIEREIVVEEGNFRAYTVSK